MLASIIKNELFQFFLDRNDTQGKIQRKIPAHTDMFLVLQISTTIALHTPSVPKESCFRFAIYKSIIFFIFDQIQ